MIGTGVILVDGFFDHAHAQRIHIKFGIVLRVACQYGDVVYAFVMIYELFIDQLISIFNRI